MTETLTASARRGAEAAEPSVTIWGLTPVQLHDRFWAARGVQVVRQGERSAIVDRAELFLLADPGCLALFKLRELVETLSWLKPKLLVLRLRDGRDVGYREAAVTEGGGRILRFKRYYKSGRDRRARVALTTDPELARAWQTAATPGEGWKHLRRTVLPESRSVRSFPGSVYDSSDPHEVADCAHDIAARWKRPDASIARLHRAERQVWVYESAGWPASVNTHGPVWMGAGRSVEEGAVVMGPAILWDEPDSRPVLEDLEWQELEPLDILNFPPPPRPGGIARRAAKRLFDVAFSLVALAVTLPLYPFIALAIVLEDGWPVFFAHRRETRGGRVFPCIKFRSMRKDADESKRKIAEANRADGPQFFIADDPRSTRVGRFLRKTQLDEIPQFWNVLAGHMSVVGPRPSPHDENQYCPPWREARLSVRPGVTGLWQVQRTREVGKDFQEWIRYDLEYVEKQSWALDLKIIWQTIVIVLTGRGKA